MFMNSYVLQVPVFQHNVKGEGGRSGVGRRRGSGGASGGEGDQERRGVGRST